MKKMMIVAIFVLAMVFMFAACGKLIDQPPPTNDSLEKDWDIAGNIVEGEVNSAKKTFAFSAASAGLLLTESLGTSTANGGVSKASGIAAEIENYIPGTELSAEKLEVINRYMTLAENLLSDGMSVTESISDREGYASKLAVSSKDLNGKQTDFILYYNEVTRAKDVDDDDDIDDDRDDTELNSVLTGILLYGDVEYTVTGKKEVEDNEYEVEFRAELDKDNYILIEQEKELGEDELEYTVVRNGVKTMQFELETTTYRNGVEVELTVIENGQHLTYLKFRKSTEGNSGNVHINAECIENNVRVKFKVFIKTDADGNETYSYRFDSGKEINLHKYLDD